MYGVEFMGGLAGGGGAGDSHGVCGDGGRGGGGVEGGVEGGDEAAHRVAGWEGGL